MDSWSSEREAQVGLVTPSAQEDGGLRRVPWRAGFGIYTCWLVAQEGHVTCQASVSKPARWKQCQKFFPGRPDPGCSLKGSVGRVEAAPVGLSVQKILIINTAGLSKVGGVALGSVSPEQRERAGGFGIRKIVQGSGEEEAAA